MIVYCCSPNMKYFCRRNRCSIHKGHKMSNDNLDAAGAARRSLLVGGGVAIAALASTQAMAAGSATAHPPVAEPVAGPYPVPPAGRTAGPIRPSRGSTLVGKVAVVTGAARGIGRAIAVEFAAN